MISFEEMLSLVIVFLIIYVIYTNMKGNTLRETFDEVKDLASSPAEVFE